MKHPKNEISKYMAKIARKAMKSLTKEERSLRGRYAVYVRECKKRNEEYYDFKSYCEYVLRGHIFKFEPVDKSIAKN